MIYNHSSDHMPEIQDRSVHCIVTSPPYPMIEKWDVLFGTQDWEEQHDILNKTWKECDRVLIDGGIFCINIGDATRTVNKTFCCYPNHSFITMHLMEKYGYIPLIPVLWKKISNRPNAFLGSGFIPPNGYISQDCEYILIFRKGAKLRSFPPKDETRYASSFTKEERDLWFQQIWSIQGAKGSGKDSSFPEEIPHRLIRMFSIVGDTVLDPYAGKGTTGKVAEELGRKFVGYEIKED